MGNCYYGPCVRGRVARASGSSDAVSATKLNQQNERQQRKTVTRNRIICICDACGKIGLISHPSQKSTLISAVYRDYKFRRNQLMILCFAPTYSSVIHFTHEIQTLSSIVIHFYLYTRDSGYVMSKRENIQ